MQTAAVVGVVSIDVIRYGGSNRAHIRFGGVAHNVAYTVAALGGSCMFVSPRHTGDVAAALEPHLGRVGVRWRPLEMAAPFAHFWANVTADGAISGHGFIDNGALETLSPAALGSFSDELAPCGAVVTCTDLAGSSLQALRNTARRLGIPFWLVASDRTTASRVLALEPLPDVACLNLEELSQVCEPRHDDRSIARAARGLVCSGGVAVVTLAGQGALLVDSAADIYWRQVQDDPATVHAIGAGDVLAAALLESRLRSVGWSQALATATAVANRFVVDCGLESGHLEGLRSYRHPERRQL